jgi:lysophospholipase L1-like esterase
VLRDVVRPGHRFPALCVLLACLAGGCGATASHDVRTAGTLPRAGVSGFRTAQCDEGLPGPVTLQWTARYHFSAGTGDQPQIRIVSVSSGAGAAAANEKGPWTLSWVAAGGTVTRIGSSPQGLPTIRVNAAKANLLSPDHNCSLVLSANSYQKPIAVIGDSVFAGIEDRLSTTGLPDATFAGGWLITSESGFGWGASAPAWPLSTIRGSWVIGIARGLSSIDPSCLVVELGANDALRASFADALGEPQLAASIRSAAKANISQLLAQSAGMGTPVVLVTVPTYPTTSFGGGLAYAKEARLVNTIIWTAAKAAVGRVSVADWATYSAAHHGVAGSATGWFSSDGLHPNEEGEEALVSLVLRAT